MILIVYINCCIIYNWTSPYGIIMWWNLIALHLVKS
jgi:hypothetical protein